MSTASTITIYGASDDLIEIEGELKGCDEYNDTDAHFILTGPDGQVRIRCWYTRRGLWAIAVAPVDEGAPMLPVNITAEPTRGYSALATIENVTGVFREVPELA